MTPIAGWYDDPQVAQLARYWDGGQWTEHTQRLTEREPQYIVTPAYSGHGGDAGHGGQSGGGDAGYIPEGGGYSDTAGTFGGDTGSMDAGFAEF